MAHSQRVTLGVPGYRGEPFIEETLHSIQQQTHRDFAVLISLDGPQPALAELCRPFLRDARFQLVVQPERLGWVGNLNWLMDQVTTPFWCYHQQDDLLEPTYLEMLIDYAARAPEAAVVYCDIVAFGAIERIITQPSVGGSASARQLALLYEHHSAVAFRGLTRLEALRHSGRLRDNEVNSFSCDTIWMSSIARWGELRRVPAQLYRKRYHEEGEHRKWGRWPAAQRTRAWLVHCAQMLVEAMLVETTPHERRLLWLATIHRLVTSRTAPGYLPEENFTATGRAALLTAFYDYLRANKALDLPQWLHADWPEIQDWTAGFLHAPGNLSAPPALERPAPLLERLLAPLQREGK